MKNFVLLISLVLLFLPGFSQQVGDYLAAPFPTYLTASPDGKDLAWVFNDKGERNIFYAKAPDYQTQVLTTFRGDQGIDLGPLVFSPDGKSLLFVRGNPKNGNGYAANPAQLQENTNKKIYRLDLSTGDRVTWVLAPPLFLVQTAAK